jgi:DNA-binding NarL/FixJ family response regulator
MLFMKAVSVVLVHDQELLREGIGVLLKSGSRIDVVASVHNGVSAIPLIRKLKPSLIVVVVAMPELNGILAARHIRDAFPQLNIVVLLALSLSDGACKALATQSLGHLVQAASAGELIDAVHAIHEGRPHPCVTPQRPPARRGSVPRAFGRGKPLAVLSVREREVLLLIVKGWTSKEIAARLGIAASTVDTYRARIMEKFGLTSLAGLVAFALKQGVSSRE